MSLNTLKCQSNVGDISASPSPSKKIVLHNGKPFSNGQLLKILCHINKPGIQDHGTGQYFRNRFVKNKYGISFFYPRPRLPLRLKRGIDFGLNRGYSGSKVMWKLWLNNECQCLNRYLCLGCQTDAGFEEGHFFWRTGEIINLHKTSGLMIRLMC